MCPTSVSFHGALERIRGSSLKSLGQADRGLKHKLCFVWPKCGEMDEGEETSAGKFHIEVLPLSVFFLCRLTELLKIKEAHLKWTVIKPPYCYCQQLQNLLLPQLCFKKKKYFRACCLPEQKLLWRELFSHFFFSESSTGRENYSEGTNIPVTGSNNNLVLIFFKKHM